MNMTSRGKIGRLPKAVQEALNRRMQNGERGKVLVAWLNGQKPVRDIMKEEFSGQPIVEQNLSEWRKRGYQQWLWREEAREMARDMAEETAELQSPNVPSLTDQMASWVTVRYLMAVRKLIEASQDKEPDLKLLRNFLHDVVMVRRGDHSHARVKMHQEQLDREREKTDAELITHFQEWVEHHNVRELIRDTTLNRKERQERLSELCHQGPCRTGTPSEGAPEAKAEGRMQNAEVGKAETPCGGVPDENAEGRGKNTEIPQASENVGVTTDSSLSSDGNVPAAGAGAPREVQAETDEVSVQTEWVPPPPPNMRRPVIVRSRRNESTEPVDRTRDSRGEPIY
jgi:hypothetical protein